MYKNAKLYFSKFITTSRSPIKVNLKKALIAFIGGFVTVFILISVSDGLKIPLLMAPFGASCVLVFGVPEAPLSQPRNIIGGHLITTASGLLVLYFLGSGVWAVSIGVGMGIALMMMTKTTHPPAGANPIIVITSVSSWTFLLTPVLMGSVIVVCVALIYNNLIKNRKYPMFWF